MKRCQFTAWDRDNFPKYDNNKYLFYEEVSTGLSTEICTYVYKNNKGFMSKDEVISELLEIVRKIAEYEVEMPEYDWSDWNGGDAKAEVRKIYAEFAKNALLSSESRPKGEGK